MANYNTIYNYDVVKDIVNLENKINEEKDNTEVDKEKIAKMRIQQWYRGLAMNTSYFGNNNKQPY